MENMGACSFGIFSVLLFKIMFFVSPVIRNKFIDRLYKVGIVFDNAFHGVLRFRFAAKPQLFSLVQPQTDYFAML